MVERWRRGSIILRLLTGVLSQSMYMTEVTCLYTCTHVYSQLYYVHCRLAIADKNMALYKEDKVEMEEKMTTLKSEL